MSISPTSPWNVSVAARLSRAAETLMSRAELSARAAVAPNRLAIILDRAGTPTLDEFYNLCAALELSPNAALGGLSSTDNSLSSLRLKTADIALTVAATSKSLAEIERKAAVRHAEIITLLAAVVARFGNRTKPVVVHGAKIGLLNAEEFRQFHSQANCAEQST